MIFIINSQGTTQSVLHEPINQGSNGANQIILVAPFAQSVVPTVAFTLPNGIQTEPYLMTPFQNNTGEILYDADKNAYNMWSVDIDYPITEYSGLVDVQFALYLGGATEQKPNGKVLRTCSTSFAVAKGVGVAPENQLSHDTYMQILDYLASINADSQIAIAKSIEYMRYLAPSEYLQNTNLENSNLSLSTLEYQIDQVSDFTVSGMTHYLTPENLKEPKKSRYFFKIDDEEGTDTGFEIDFTRVLPVSLVQLYIYDYDQEITLSYYYKNAFQNEWMLAQTIKLPPLADPSAIEIVQLKTPMDDYGYPVKIKIVQEGIQKPCTFKGVELWGANANGKYEIVRNNGNISYIDTYDAQTFLNTLTQLENRAKAGADTAQWWANGETNPTKPIENPNSAKSYADASKASLEQLNSKANKAGGYPVLEEIVGEEYPKIPSIYLNQIDIKEYKKITSESQLDTIEAQKGDVAILVEPEYQADENGNLVPTGKKVITKSWLLYDVEGGERIWIKYGMSYATNAGYATYANNAGNASKINGMNIDKLSQSAFNNLEDKNGIYFVVIGE